MLVLSRKQGESIRIGEEIVVRVVEVRRGRVILGVEAPKDIPIRRGADGSDAAFDQRQPEGAANPALAER